MLQIEVQAPLRLSVISLHPYYPTIVASKSQGSNRRYTGLRYLSLGPLRSSFRAKVSQVDSQGIAVDPVRRSKLLLEGQGRHAV